MSERTINTVRTRAVYVCLDPGVPAYGHKGCSIHVQAILRELVARFDEVELVAARTGGPTPDGLGSVEVHELGRPSSPDAASAERDLVALDSRAAGLVGRRCGPGTVVMQRYSLWSCEAIERAAACGAATVIELNAPLVDEQARHRVLVDREVAVARTRRVLRAADHAYAVSTPVARWGEALADRPVAVVPNGVDSARFAVAGSRPAGDALTVAFVGTFRPWHGLGELVEAAARWVDEGRRPRLLLVGDGPARKDTVMRAVSIGAEVEAPGAVGPEAVPRLLAAAHVAVAPYPPGAHYFSPLKVFEYLAAGLPTVAADVGDLRRLLADGREVVLVPPGDAAALAAAVARLHDDPARAAAIGAAGRAAARQRFTWRAVVERVLAPLDGRTVRPVA